VVVLLTLRDDTLEALLASPVWFALLAIGYFWKGRKAA
jgi:D-serine/D-alanine/glycine transporter